MRKIIILMFAVTLVLTVSGCNGKAKNQSPEKPDKVQNQTGKRGTAGQNEKEYYVGSDAPVDGLRDWVNKYKPYTGVYQQKIGNYRVVLISMGEKFTGGYGVHVQKAEKTGDQWVIIVSFSEPKDSDMTTQNINYPLEVVSVRDNGKPVEVIDVTNNVEKKMKTVNIPQGKQLPVSKNFIIMQPLEGETISSPVTVRGKARVFEAVFGITIEDGHYHLAKKTAMTDMGAPEWGNFELTIPFDKPTNPYGQIIFSYENMADGSMIEDLVVPVKF